MTDRPSADRRLRVVFVDHVARLSGAELALLNILPSLAAEVDVQVVLGEDGPLVDRLRDSGIPTDVMPMASSLRDVRKEKTSPGDLDPRALVHLPRYVARLSRRLRALDADLVHTNSLKAALYGGAAARLVHIPAVWHLRDRIAPDYLPRSAVALVRSASRTLPTAVVANSRTTLDTLPRLDHSWVVYNAVAPDPAPSIPRSAPQVARESVVGLVGRLAPWKGQHVFLDAFAEAFRGTEVRGRIIGSAIFDENQYANALRRQVERLGISGQIEFRGFRAHIWTELAELDVLVHCSVIPEPFGQVVLEGMAAGVPVIASGAGGPAELITSGVDGILTAPGDVPELAATLRRLHDDAGLRAELAVAGQRRASEFTPERTAAKLISIYREIISAP